VRRQARKRLAETLGWYGRKFFRAAPTRRCSSVAAIAASASSGLRASRYSSSSTPLSAEPRTKADAQAMGAVSVSSAT